jgi:hypothetical protein
MIGICKSINTKSYVSAWYFSYPSSPLLATSTEKPNMVHEKKDQENDKGKQQTFQLQNSSEESLVQKIVFHNQNFRIAII